MTPKYIDANQIQWHSNWLISGDERVYAYLDEVDNIPTADVEKVIRCKNCRFARCELSVVRYYGGGFLCARTGLNLLDGNGYCSWAELATDRPIEREEKTDGRHDELSKNS